MGGQKTIRAYWRNYFEQTDGIVWVVDSVDPWRLEECRSQLRDLLSQEKVPCHPTLPRESPPPLTTSQLAGASLLILANKQDLGGALSQEQISEALDLRNEDIAGRHWRVLGCSAVTSAGLLEGFDWIVRDIASRIFMMS